MPGLKTTTFGTGDYTWLRNTDGLDDAAITAAAPIANFVAGTHYPNGYLPSGTAVRIDDLDNVRLWADVAGARLGFLKGDHKVSGATGDTQVNVAVITRGNINIAKLPFTFIPPTVAGAGFQPQFFTGV